MSELSIEEFIETAKYHINSTPAPQTKKEIKIIEKIINEMGEDKEMIEEYNELKEKCNVLLLI